MEVPYTVTGINPNVIISEGHLKRGGEANVFNMYVGSERDEFVKRFEGLK
jgi:hypothetical protein